MSTLIIITVRPVYIDMVFTITRSLVYVDRVAGVALALVGAKSVDALLCTASLTCRLTLVHICNHTEVILLKNVVYLRERHFEKVLSGGETEGGGDKYFLVLECNSNCICFDDYHSRIGVGNYFLLSVCLCVCLCVCRFLVQKDFSDKIFLTAAGFLVQIELISTSAVALLSKQ